MDPANSALLCTVQKALGALCALLLFGRPAGLLDVAGLLNCDAKTARKQLDLLVRQRLVSLQTFQNGYTVTGRGLNFWFGECGKFSHFAASSTAISCLSEKDESEEVAKIAEKVGKPGLAKKAAGNGSWKRQAAGNSETKDPGGEDLPNETLAAENLAAFRGEGVGHNWRVSQVCRLTHVTPAFIHAQARRLRQEKRFHPGLLLHVVENEDPFPCEEPQDESEDRYRYIRGKYAEYIAGSD